MKALLIAEKPDLARQIEACYNKHRNEINYEIDFLAQRGHLVTLYSPDQYDESLKKWSWNNMPIYPEKYGGWKYQPIKDKSNGKYKSANERLKEIKNALNSGNYDFVIHAGDPDQEGELLVNLVLDYCHNKLPVSRFWTNDLTDSKILDALQNLKDDKTDKMLINLLSASLVRQHWDWIFGMNVSRGVAINMNSSNIACGRVKTPLLAIVCKREEEIKNFQPTTVYGLKAHYTQSFDGTHINLVDKKDDEYADEDEKEGVVWLDTKDEALKLKNSLNLQGKVVKVTKKVSSTYSPKQFKLSTAQMVAGKNGISDDVTLATIQSLYEKKFMSYPRTDCEYLSSNEDFGDILNNLKKIPEFTNVINGISQDDIDRVKKSKKWCNDKALEESGHSALKPTNQVPNLEQLNSTEKFIYLMICRRFIAMFLPPLKQNAVEIISEVIDKNNETKTFKASGKTTIDKGFSSFFKMDIKEVELPNVNENDILNISEYEITEKTSSCPKRLTSPDLIGICENPAKYLNDKELQRLGKRLKIGTPATRSSTIQDLINKQKYLEEIKEGKRQVLVPTNLGQQIYDYLKDFSISKVDMTGVWEEYLESIRKGESLSQDIDDKLKSEFETLLNQLKDKAPETPIANSDNVGTQYTCPVCLRPIKHISKKGKYDFYTCRSGKDDATCNFSLNTSFNGENLLKRKYQNS